MWHFGWQLQVISYHPVKFGVAITLVGLDIKRFWFVTWLHMVTWSKDHATWWLLITSHHPVKSSSNRLRGSKDVTIFICHVNSRNHVIQKICSFLVGHMTLNHKQHFCQLWQQQVKRKWIYNIFHLCDLILARDQQVMWLGY